MFSIDAILNSSSSNRSTHNVTYPYDYGAGLRRLSWDTRDYDITLRQELAMVPPPSPQLFNLVTSPVVERDMYSTGLLRYCPTVTSDAGFYAARVSTDADSLFKSASLLITGRPIIY